MIIILKVECLKNNRGRDKMELLKIYLILMNCLILGFFTKDIVEDKGNMKYSWLNIFVFSVPSIVYIILT